MESCEVANMSPTTDTVTGVILYSTSRASTHPRWESRPPRAAHPLYIVLRDLCPGPQPLRYKHQRHLSCTDPSLPAQGYHVTRRNVTTPA